MEAIKRIAKVLDFIIFSMALCVGTTTVFIGCRDEIKSTITYTVNEPVYMSFAEFRAPQPPQPAQTLVNPGKICLYGDYLFINEVGKGIHVINNQNPALPQPVAFIELQGNIDIVVKDHLLFADNYIDLVWFDITNPEQPVESGRLEKAFNHTLPAPNNNYPIGEIDYEKGVIVGWVPKEITKEEEYHSRNIVYDDVASFTNNGGGAASPVATMTGSMSRFAVYGDYLYVVYDGMLKTFSLTESGVEKDHEQHLDWNVETIFAYQQKLFLGTTSGLLIYGLTNPAQPKYVSALNHIMGCDPVVVQGAYAYVTVRGGNTCGQDRSLLDVIDITDPFQPFTVASFDMASPYGLGIDGNTLFVCDEGLKVFDAADPLQIGTKLLKHFDNITGFDVIPYNNTLILTGNGGLYQYDYSDIQDIKQLSVLRVGKN
jgi:hypothetical protein